MAKKALLIGINYINSPNQLYGCINDVINMRNMLIDAYGYDSNNITVLREYTNNLPTRANIINNITSIVSQSGNLKELWIHYSGHGSQIGDRNNDETDGLDEIIVPLDYQDSGFITDDVIFNIMKKTANAPQYLFLILAPVELFATLCGILMLLHPNRLMLLKPTMAPLKIPTFSVFPGAKILKQVLIYLIPTLYNRAVLYQMPCLNVSDLINTMLILQNCILM